MTNVQKLTTAKDADAAYILGKLAEAVREDNAAESSHGRAKVLRDEATKRLIEVHTRLVAEKKVSATSKNNPTTPGWNAWLDANGINKGTAHRLMQQAGWTEEQREKHKAKDRARKAATSIIQKASGKPVGGTQKRKLRAAGIDLDTKLEEGSAEAEAVIAKAAAILDTTVVTRADLSLSMQQKYDRALAKALLDQKAEQEATFWKKVDEEVKRRLPDEKARALQAIKDYGLKMKGVASQMSVEDYRFVCRVLHPDRQPSEDERAKAFAIVRKLDNYITVANR